MLLIKIKKNGEVSNTNKSDLDFIVKNKNIDKLYIWEYNDCELILYGSIDGKAGCENKYELPPPLDNNLFFNDLYIIKYIKEPVNFSLDEYNIFYDESYGGFEEIDFSDNEVESTLSEHSSDRDFIDDDTISDFSNKTNDITSSITSSFSNNKEDSYVLDSDEDEKNDSDSSKEDNYHQ